ncbi:MAG: PAS domain-containing sensor histidine kinase [Gammaproteobacteria bacterium]|nr:PAS domain-containing sensor histidine kinase [Gammaproteobacteria bacterium]
MATQTPPYPGQIANVWVVYNIYRIVLPLVLAVTFISNPDSTPLGSFNDTLFIRVSIAYVIFALSIAFLAPIARNLFENAQILTATMIVDIIAITLILFSSGGVVSGLGLLLIVTIASGSILIRGRISTFLAAVAALSIIYCEIYLSLVIEDPLNLFLVQAGILGTFLFATALIIQALTDRIYKSAAIADKQAGDILKLEKLNNEIIQRMRTGVVVVNSEQRIMSMNSAASLMLASSQEQETSKGYSQDRLPTAMNSQLEKWKSNTARHLRPIQMPNSSKQIQLGFAFLNPESKADVLVFLEDNRQIVQRVQQMKLASLGRLTASIAHEVRNPLGAISHASQLLCESENIVPDDKRILEIILDHCKRVNVIIEDILNASRHEESIRQKIVLKDWLEQFINEYIETHSDCGDISLKVEPEDTEINVIAGQLEQILANLFENGLRYSEQETGIATLSIKAGIENKDGDPQPFLHIIDDGPGIDEDIESRLFEPFYTTDSQGTGLGLYISKELCEANQSQLIYGKTKEGRSQFSIYFSHPEISIA